MFIDTERKWRRREIGTETERNREIQRQRERKE